MPNSSSTSSAGKSSTRKITSPAILRKASGRALNAASARAAKSSSDGAFPNSLIRHHDMRRFGRADFEEADVQRLLRLHRTQRLACDGAQGFRVERLLPASRLAGLR